MTCYIHILKADIVFTGISKLLSMGRFDRFTLADMMTGIHVCHEHCYTPTKQSIWGGAM